MIITPKYKEMYTDKPISVNMGVGGEFRLIVRDSMGKAVQDTGWFHNTLLNGGLLNMGNLSTWASYFHVGSSNAAVNQTQSALVAWLAESNTTPVSDINENLGAADYEGRTTRAKRFPAGGGAVTIREVGISSSSPNSNLSIRALVTPEVDKSSEQVLDMYYRFTAFPSQIDATGSVTIDGILYNYIARPGTIDETAYTFNQWSPDSSGIQRAYDGDIGDLFNIPAGSSDSSTSVAVDSVTANTVTGTSAYHMFFDLDDGNLGSGLRSIASQVKLGSGASNGLKLQVQFGTGVDATGDPIPKINTKVLTFDLKLEWSRH
jgi:hypothetical protein